MDDLEYKILRKFHRPKKVDIKDVERYVGEFPFLLKKTIRFRYGDGAYFTIIKLTEEGYEKYLTERTRRNPVRKFFHNMVQ